MEGITKLPMLLPALLLLFTKALIGSVSSFKYQAVMYFANAWHLGVFNASITFEPFVKFEDGPKLKSIDEYLATYKPTFENIEEASQTRIIEAVRRELNESQYLILVDAIIGYGSKTEDELRDLLKDDPVWQTEESGGGHPLPVGAVVPEEAIKRAYADERAC